MDALLSGLINDAGGTLSSYIDFDYRGLYCCLSYKDDIIPLKLDQNRLSNHLMDWFRVWYNPQVTDIKCNVMSPYTLHLLVGWVRSSKGDGSDSFRVWIEKKWKANVNEVDVLFVPYYGKNHWSLFVMSDECFLHYDSLRTAKLHDDKHIRIYLAKMWATLKGIREGSPGWKNCSNTEIWKDCIMPQQQSNWECGYYVLKCITDICTRKRTTPTDMWKVS